MTAPGKPGDALAPRTLNSILIDKYPYNQPGDVRVLIHIMPLRVATMETAMPDFGAGG